MTTMAQKKQQSLRPGIARPLLLLFMMPVRTCCFASIAPLLIVLQQRCQTGSFKLLFQTRLNPRKFPMHAAV